MFGGKPADAMSLVLLEEAEGIISEDIINEIVGVLYKKFSLPQKKLDQVEESLRQDFSYVLPVQRLTISRDPDDNKVLEAAIEGRCDYIVTGDKDLLVLKKYKNIRIVTSKEFIDNFTAR